MRVAFLDIDGVLVNRRSLKERSGLKAVGDPRCVYALNYLLQVSMAKVVVSSSWRFCGLEEMRLILCHWGMRGDVIDITPDLTRKVLGVYSAVERGEEIQQWLDEHPEYTDYVILDDDDPGERWHQRWVRTVFERGMTEHDARRALQLFFASTSGPLLSAEDRKDPQTLSTSQISKKLGDCNADQ